MPYPWMNGLPNHLVWQQPLEYEQNFELATNEIRSNSYIPYNNSFVFNGSVANNFNMNPYYAPAAAYQIPQNYYNPNVAAYPTSNFYPTSNWVPESYNNTFQTEELGNLNPLFQVNCNEAKNKSSSEKTDKPKIFGKKGKNAPNIFSKRNKKPFVRKRLALHNESAENFLLHEEIDEILSEVLDEVAIQVTWLCDSNAAATSQLKYAPKENQHVIGILNCMISQVVSDTEYKSLKNEISIIVESLIHDSVVQCNNVIEHAVIDQTVIAAEATNDNLYKTNKCAQDEDIIILSESLGNRNYSNHVTTENLILQKPDLLEDIAKIVIDLINKVITTNHDTKETKITSSVPTADTPSLFYPKKSKLMSKFFAKKFTRKSIESHETNKNVNSDSPTESLSYKDLEPLKRRRSDNISFTSKDREENKDIESDGWNSIKLLKSDQEYINNAQQKLGNREKSDPCQCMSYHGYKRLTMANDNPDLLKLRAKNYSNSKRIDMRSKLVLKIRDGKMLTVKYETHSGQPKKRKNLDIESLPNPKRIKLVLFENYEKALCQVLATYKKIDLPSDWKYFLRHFKISMIETKGFLKHYLEDQVDDSGRFLMPLGFFEKAVCMEMIFRTFIKYYGPNEKARCKDCEFMDKSNGIIRHTT